LKIDITQITHKRIKQQYYKLALLSHPDKTQSDNQHYNDISFNEIKDAHDFLIHYITNNDNDCNQYCDHNSNDIKYNLFYYILENIFLLLNFKFNDYTEIFNFIKQLNLNELNELKQILINIKHLLPHDIYKYLYDTNNNNFIQNIYPDFNDLITHNILIINHNNSKFYVPSWHNEIYFDNLTVILKPSLPNYITIDNFNNLHISISQNILSILDPSFNTPNQFPFIKPINSNTLSLHIHNISYEFNINKIHIKKKQIIKLFNKGIPTILNSNIYSNKYISNLFIHLNLF
jgi:hypothetical protein